MDREVFEIVKGMDGKAPETLLALQCAPLLTGLKMSNLLIVPQGYLEQVAWRLAGTDIFSYILYMGGEKAVLLLYRARPLEKYLAEPNVREVLGQSGYRSLRLRDLLASFAARYTAYRNKQAGFPHEMGLFLGYPVEDVVGFVENKGKNYLYAGYWKVYRNKKQKQQLFRKYDRAKEALIRLLAQGVNLSDVICVCSDNW